MATKYEGLTSAQWANRIVDFNPGKFDKSALIKHYTRSSWESSRKAGVSSSLRRSKVLPPRLPPRLRRMMR